MHWSTTLEGTPRALHSSTPFGDCSFSWSRLHSPWESCCRCCRKKKLIVKIRNIEDSKFSYKPFFFNYFWWKILKDKQKLLYFETSKYSLLKKRPHKWHYSKSMVNLCLFEPMAAHQKPGNNGFISLDKRPAKLTRYLPWPRFCQPISSSPSWTWPTFAALYSPAPPPCLLLPMLSLWLWQKKYPQHFYSFQSSHAHCSSKREIGG